MEIDSAERYDILKDSCKQTLQIIGENPEREGLLKTPERVAKTLLELTRGYDMDPLEVLNSAKFKEDYSQTITIKDIEF